MKHQNFSVTLLLASLLGVNLLIGCGTAGKTEDEPGQPNVIFFATDDLNDWVEPLAYNRVITPNLERLAEAGVCFTNAHTAGVFCAPSRNAIFSGLHASTTGLYGEDVFQYDHPDLVTLQMAFKEGGYNTFGAGKLYHHMPGFIDLRGWNEYFARSQKVKDMGYQMNPYWQLDVPHPQPWPYSPWYRNSGREYDTTRYFGTNLEWGPIPNQQEEDMAASIRINWACDVLKRDHDKPFFLAAGLFTTHYPNYAPQKYFDMYDLESIELPPYNPDDKYDLSPRMQDNIDNWMRTHRRLEDYGALKEAVQAYLACITYTDALLGRVLDALEESPYVDNTILVFWSDHGYHHGEKGRWGKHTLWQRTSQVPFLWAGKGIAHNAEVATTVSLIDMYPTFVELCNLPVERNMDGVSLASVLRNPASAKDRNVLLPHMERGGYAVINADWRYIRYYDGYEELYDVKKDPHEWENLANDPRNRGVMDEMKKSGPAIFAPPVTSRRELDLVIEGDSFYWKKRDDEN